MDSALPATRNSSSRSLARAIRALGCAALAAALLAGVAAAQTPEPAVTESKSKASEQTARDATVTPPSVAEPAAGDATPAPPSADKTSAAKPPKHTSEPFKPSERIQAESVVSFPEDI